jgi:beta-mannan synthase
VALQGRLLTSALLLARVPAGVWRIKAINDAGGWESDTVVEDMDLSLRVYLKGWRSIYLHDVKCPNELPSTLSAYKTQQFRWLSGPMQIVRKSFANIWFSK